MKKTYVVTFLILSVSLYKPSVAKAQSQEAQQLILDVVKLTELKKILNDLYDGYEIVSKGYGAIKNISAGNFNLHKNFLDGLLAVNPEIGKYKRIADITRFQLSIVKEYKSAFSSFSQSGSFSTDELGYMSGVYSNLFDRSLQNLDALLMVITANKLRMSDDERLSAIDRIYNQMEDMLSFLRSFNGQAKMLGIQRKLEKQDVNRSRQLYNLR